MNLQECLFRLARGKLSNLSLSEGGDIRDEFKPKVIDAINEALARIYTILPIKEKSLVVELREGKTDYRLSSEHSLMNAKGGYFDDWDYYIMDTPDNPFMDDILTITEIHDDLCRKRPMNDPDSPLGIYIPEPNLIIVKFGIDNRVLNISYRAKHLVLTEESLEEIIHLPENLYGALFSYVAYLVHSDMNTQEAIANAQKYFSEYQVIVNDINMYGTLPVDRVGSDSLFTRRGWV